VSKLQAKVAVAKAAGAPPEEVAALKVEAAKAAGAPPEEVAALEEVSKLQAKVAVAKAAGAPPEEVAALEEASKLHTKVAVAKAAGAPPEEVAALKVEAAKAAGAPPEEVAALEEELQVKSSAVEAAAPKKVGASKDEDPVVTNDVPAAQNDPATAAQDDAAARPEEKQAIADSAEVETHQSAHGRRVSVIAAPEPELMEYLEAKFKQVDKDDSGTLTVEEFCELAATLALNLTDAEVEDLRIRIDTSGDGIISWHEVEAAMPQMIKEIYADEEESENDWCTIPTDIEVEQPVVAVPQQNFDEERQRLLDDFSKEREELLARFEREKAEIIGRYESDKEGMSKAWADEKAKLLEEQHMMLQERMRVEDEHEHDTFRLQQAAAENEAFRRLVAELQSLLFKVEVGL
jgi:hypothetical protein